MLCAGGEASVARNLLQTSMNLKWSPPCVGAYTHRPPLLATSQRLLLLLLQRASLEQAAALITSRVALPGPCSYQTTVVGRHQSIAAARPGLPRVCDARCLLLLLLMVRHYWPHQCSVACYELPIASVTCEAHDVVVDLRVN